MRSAPHLVLRADAGPTIGSGHVMRCLALADAWRRRGGRAMFLTCSDNGPLQAQIQNAGHGLSRLDTTYPHPQDLEQTICTLQQTGARWLALDGYHFDRRFHSGIRSAGSRLLVIDDNAHLPYYDANVVLNQNLHAPQLPYACASDSRLLLGPDYALLRSEYVDRAAPTGGPPRIARRILVTMGGSDAPNMTASVIRALYDIDLAGIETKVVIGPGNPHRATIEQMLQGSKGNIQIVTTDARPGIEQIVRNPKSEIRNPTMSDLMARADVAVSAAGSTCWELAYMGVPAALIITADNQVRLAQSIEARGGAMNLGWHHTVTPAIISAALQSLITDQHRRAMMREAGRSLVDGRGAARVADVLMNWDADDRASIRSGQN